MNNPGKSATVQILDKSYQIRCSPEEAETLQRAVLLLDAKMRKIRDSQQVAGTERIAIVAALTISHEFLCCQDQHEKDTHETNERLFALLQKIENSLTPTEQLEL